MDKCPKCKEKQWSQMDKVYVGLFGNCWSCDRLKWENKEITLEEFEKREQQALKETK